MAITPEDLERYDKSGSAFPMRGAEFVNFGLTVREYFAATAMQGLLAADIEAGLKPKGAANCAVAFADALIAALNKGHRHE